MNEVAATYRTWETKGKPFTEDGKKYYIIVINPKTNKEKTVRWYGEIPVDYYHLLGFDKGFIWVFSGITKENHEFFAASNARYAWFFGWYVVSTESLPENLPQGVVAHKLMWQDSFMNATARKAATEQLIGEIYED